VINSDMGEKIDGASLVAKSLKEQG